MISGGTFQVTGKSSAAIGGGYASGGDSHVDDISISGTPTITARSSQAAAIGGGSGGSGAYVRELTIEGGTVDASTTGSGAAIGDGSGGDGAAGIYNVYLKGGSLILNGSTAGVSATLSLILGGNGIAIDCKSASGHCFASGDIKTAGTAFINVTTHTQRFRQKGKSVDFRQGIFYGQYAVENTESEGLTDAYPVPYVHFARFTGLPKGQLHMDFHCPSHNYHLPVVFDSENSRGLILVLAHSGTYRIAITGVRETGYLCGSEGKEVTIAGRETFLANIDFCAGLIDDDSGGLSSGAKAAIAIGALVVGGIIIGVVAYKIRAAVQPKFDKDGMDEYVLDSEAATTYHPSQA